MSLKTIQTQKPSSKPFVKWAGGKRQLIPILNQNLPENFGTYYEPFLGGGALFFKLINQNYSKRHVISDSNPLLIQTYEIIRDHLSELILSLKEHSKNYAIDSFSYYYHIRDNESDEKIEKISRFLFLNRTCFNGLYRVNKKGKFNVPFGKYTNPNIVNEENLNSVSNLLQSENISIKCCDFESIFTSMKKDDFVYFDPPYFPINKTSSFTKYTSSGFNLNDHIRLYKLIKKLNKKGCKILLSNSNSKEIVDLFSNEFLTIKKINANRCINSIGSNRTDQKEMLFKNF